MNDQRLEQRVAAMEKSLALAKRETKAVRIAMDRLGIIARRGKAAAAQEQNAKELGEWAMDALRQMASVLRGEELAFHPPAPDRHLRAVEEMDAQVAADQAFDAEVRARTYGGYA